MMCCGSDIQRNFEFAISLHRTMQKRGNYIFPNTSLVNISSRSLQPPNNYCRSTFSSSPLQTPNRPTTTLHPISPAVSIFTLAPGFTRFRPLLRTFPVRRSVSSTPRPKPNRGYIGKGLPDNRRSSPCAFLPTGPVPALSGSSGSHKPHR